MADAVRRAEAVLDEAHRRAAAAAEEAASTVAEAAQRRDELDREIDERLDRRRQIVADLNRLGQGLGALLGDLPAGAPRQSASEASSQ